MSIDLKYINGKVVQNKEYKLKKPPKTNTNTKLKTSNKTNLKRRA